MMADNTTVAIFRQAPTCRVQRRKRRFVKVTRSATASFSCRIRTGNFRRNAGPGRYVVAGSVSMTSRGVTKIQQNGFRHMPVGALRARWVDAGKGIPVPHISLPELHFLHLYFLHICINCFAKGRSGYLEPCACAVITKGYDPAFPSRVT